MFTLPRHAEPASAADIVYRHLALTPQWRWPRLCEVLGADTWLEHENHTPVVARVLAGADA